MSLMDMVHFNSEPSLKGKINQAEEVEPPPRKDETPIRSKVPQLNPSSSNHRPTFEWGKNSDSQRTQDI
ncbi:hypothetical protein AVEN_172573-1 [Araneus ventricosus]|uniref:Uncharacterized protein n=1 Tax=Araneus ventricosus TaxID=182803 RepID=A0A4Y2W4Q4_ARAVE|nr:hypothetical protein AVEN_136140-1 [Araneus ventricosus]GBO31526.1 hypothetical protein AVEN_172573-1 [Araneus ventricosus]